MNTDSKRNGSRLRRLAGLAVVGLLLPLTWAKVAKSHLPQTAPANLSLPALLAMSPESLLKVDIAEIR